MVDNIGNNSEIASQKYNFAGACHASCEDSIIKEQDRLLPIANVGRIMKQILPPNSKISKEAKETMQECVSEFISFVTGEASDKCHKEKRKTVNGDDICWALATLGFDDYAEPLKRYLYKYRDQEGERGSHRPSNNEERDDSLDYRGDLQMKSAASLNFQVVERSNTPLSRRF